MAQISKRVHEVGGDAALEHFANIGHLNGPR
jgi:hypothetical protein